MPSRSSIIFWFGLLTVTALVRAAESSVTVPQYARPLLQAGKECEHKKQFNRAEKCYRRSISIDPFFVDSYSALATLYSKQGQWSQAVWAAQMAVQLKPNDFLSLYQLGRLQRRAGDFERSLESLARCAPHYYYGPYCHYEKGLTFVAMRDLKGVGSQLAQLVRMDESRLASELAAAASDNDPQSRVLAPEMK